MFGNNNKNNFKDTDKIIVNPYNETVYKVRGDKKKYIINPNENKEVDIKDSTDDQKKFRKRKRPLVLLFFLNLIVFILLSIFILVKNLMPLWMKGAFFAGSIILLLIEKYLVGKRNHTKTFATFTFIFLSIHLILQAYSLALGYKVVHVIENLNSKASALDHKDAYSNGAFNMYITGMDTFGEVESISRSDVNMILTINPDTKKMLITNIPRDTYVRIPGGGDNQYDKLTHAGIYGVDASIGAIENLLDIDIQYYGKINFTSLVNIVDSLGGIEVENSQAFTSSQNGKEYPRGIIKLTGEDALVFSRERYTLENGDLDRNINQSKVFRAMFEKMMSPKGFMKIFDLLDIAETYSETDIEAKSAIDILLGQVFSPGAWDIDQVSLQGYGSMDQPSYAMPGYRLYMYVPNQESINDINQKINNTIQQ